MNPRIISLGFAVPEFIVTQEEALQILGYTSDVARQIFFNAGVDKRHSWIDPARIPTITWQEQTEEYRKGALELSLRAARECLNGRDVSQIGCIAFASTTGFECSAMSYRIAAELGLRSDAKHGNDVGGGCQGAAPAIERAYNHTIITGQPSLAISAEICSATFFPGPEEDLELMIANSLFGDGAAACLIGYDQNPFHPEIVDFESEFRREYVDYLGYRWTEGRLRVVLHKKVPKVAPMLAEPCVTRLLARNSLRLGEIDHFIVHPGGPRVLDSIRDAFCLDEEKMALSREGLRNWGNCSSCTIGLIGKLLRQQNPHGWGLVLTMGAGFATMAILLRFGT